jgi:hypothetical protein
LHPRPDNAQWAAQRYDWLKANRKLATYPELAESLRDKLPLD